MLKLVECVPNFSEGRDKNIINAITNEISSTDDVKLLDVDPGADTNRTVVTFIGSPNSVKEAAFKAIKKAALLIDMRKHHGAHARMGATDVCPFVPVSGVTTEECIELAKELGKQVAEKLNIPIYLYEEAATRPERVNLADIRAGEYEGLPDKLSDPNWKPDFGTPEFNEKSGATVIGVREFLIAYNVNLNTKDRKLANDIALSVRERGRLKRNAQGTIVRDENGTALRVPGLLEACKAVGWYIAEYGQTQISMNLVNYKTTPPHIAFDTICNEAEKRGVRVTGSELVGLIPLKAILDAGIYYLKKQGKSTGVPEEELIDIAIKSLGLSDISEFDPKQKIIEYQVRDIKGPLVKLDLRDFANELSADSPAPGGGTVSALAGALGSGLASMVSNLTIGKKDYANVRTEMENLAVTAQKLKDDLLQAVDQDTEAFNNIMAAFAMKKKTDVQKLARNNAIQEATKQACHVPLNVMKKSLDVLKIAAILPEKGNVNAVSDAGVCALMAMAGIEGAGLNVKINLRSIEDINFVTNIKSEVDSIISEAKQLHARILNMVVQKIDG